MPSSKGYPSEKNCDTVNCEQCMKGRVNNSIRRIEKDLEKQK
jgi:hypothetical protein